MRDRIFSVLRSAPASTWQHGNTALYEDDDEMVLISADELDEMHRPMPSDDLSDKAESENEDELVRDRIFSVLRSDELKGTALDD